MRTWKYKNYKEYLKHQNATTLKKNNWIYAQKHTLKKIADYKGFAVKNILCHGTRAAGEQKYFAELYPNAYIIGSEICETAENFPMTKRWDFNKPLKEWIGKFDVIYTNSFDHTITPMETLEVWKNQLNLGGTLFLEYSAKKSVYHPNDPLDATNDEVKQMIIDNNMIIRGEISEDVKHKGKVFICEVSR